jgi:hypothetical protein
MIRAVGDFSGDVIGYGSIAGGFVYGCEIVQRIEMVGLLFFKLIGV